MQKIRIYEKVKTDIQLVFQCDGTDVDNNIDEIKAIIGRDSLKQRSIKDCWVSKIQSNTINIQSLAH